MDIKIKRQTFKGWGLNTPSWHLVCETKDNSFKSPAYIYGGVNSNFKEDYFSEYKRFEENIQNIIGF